MLKIILSKSRSQPSLGTNVFNPSTPALGRQRGKGILEFQTSLVYGVNPRPVKATQ